jgi:hypothetical protein
VAGRGNTAFGLAVTSVEIVIASRFGGVAIHAVEIVIARSLRDAATRPWASRLMALLLAVTASEAIHDP